MAPSPSLARPAAFAGLVVMLSATAVSQEARDAINLAIVATASASYVSGDTSLAALRDESAPRSSRDRRRGSYGNWPRTSTQWVQYDWSREIATDRVEVYWWDDRRGVRLPSACRLLFWDGERFAPVPNPNGLGIAGARFNVTAFDEVRTTKLRLEIDSDGRFSTGILEWRVLDSGKSPDFPPIVRAGVDRCVVVGGRTFLDGSVRTLRADTEVKPAWRATGGPGSVEFADAAATSTTATFSKPGTYRLELSATAGDSKASSALTVRALPAPPARHLEPVPPARYRPQSKLWNARLKAVTVHWIPHCIAKIADPDLREGGLNNFVDAAKKLAGKPQGRHRGYVFSNAWVFNTIEAIALALMVDPGDDQQWIAAQDAMRATLDRWIPVVLAAQEPDGYLQTAFTLSDRERWSPRHRRDHEGYVAGYFLDCAVAHYLMTKGTDRRLLDAALELADCWCDHIGPSKKPWYDGHQAMEMALVRFGRFVNRIDGRGNGDKYVALAKFLLDCRGGGQTYDQSHVPVVRQYEAVGHAVRAVYSYAAMAGVAMETGDADYHSAVASLWDNIVNRKYYVTGGVGSGQTSEGFGPDWALRQDAYCESCSSCGLIFFQHKLNLTHADARYADLLEETLYNALLGSLDLDGKNFYYQNPLDTRRARYDWHVCPCCIGNIPRTLLMLPTWTYAVGDDAVYVSQFAGSAVKLSGIAGTDVEIVQKTDYPWSGDVSITIDPAEAKTFTVYVRAPDRAVSALYTATPAARGIARVSVNGDAVTPRPEKGYVAIRREWKRGDRIDLVLPLRPQRVKGSARIAATEGRVALRYGPLLYNVERVDQDITKVLAPDATLEAVWDDALLGGVMTIRGKWADGSALLAIPNFARANRLPPGSRDRRRRRAPESIVWMRDR